MKGASLGQATALLENIRLGCKCLPRINTLAYYVQTNFTDVKSFITLSPGVNFKNIFARNIRSLQEKQLALKTAVNSCDSLFWHGRKLRA